MKPYAPKLKRTPINFKITSRDLETLRFIATAKYCRSGQVKRLLFQNGSMTVTHRRLKFLYHGGLLGRTPTSVQMSGHGQSELAYSITKTGAALVKEHFGIKCVVPKPRLDGTVSQFLKHVLDVTEFEVNLRLALRDHPTIALFSYMNEFKLKSYIHKGLKNDEIFELCNTLTDRDGITRKMYPDAAFILQHRESQTKALYFYECDRGSETYSRIREEKCLSYYLYRQRNLGQKIWGIPRFTVLISTPKSSRSIGIRKAIETTLGSKMIWITEFPQITEETILSCGIWKDWKGEERSILK